MLFWGFSGFYLLMHLAHFFWMLIWVHTLQWNPTDRIKKWIERGEYDKAHTLIKKAYLKTPEDPGIYYLHASLLFTPAYTHYDPDSARQVAQLARQLWAEAPVETKHELEDRLISVATVDTLAKAIEDHFFSEVLAGISADKIRLFQEKYPGSSYNELLFYKQDSLDFARALGENTESAYLQYINKYPKATFRPLADSLLDGIRYDALVRDGSLAAYQRFRKTYPASRYLDPVEAFIFRHTIVSDEEAKLETFVKEAKTSKWRKVAQDYLYFMAPSSSLLSDSAQHAREMLSITLFPIIEEGIYGFIDQEGTKRIACAYRTIPEEAKCEGVQDSWLYVRDEVDGKVILKDGNILLRGVEGYRSVSESMGLIQRDAQWYLYHKSGYPILQVPVEDVVAFENHWFKARIAGKWGLYTPAGLPIAEPLYEEIFVRGHFWVFVMDGLRAVYTPREIMGEIEDRGLSLEFKFEELEWVSDSLVIGFREGKECLLDKNLEFLIPWGAHEIYPAPRGAYVKTDIGFRLFRQDLRRLGSKSYLSVASNKGWRALQETEGWTLFSQHPDTAIVSQYDSIKLVGAYGALVFESGSKRLLFKEGASIDLEGEEIRSFSDYPSFLVLKSEDTLRLLDPTGREVLAGVYDELTLLSDTLVSISIEGKVGLASTGGRFWLNPIFDNLDLREGLISTLYEGKIGSYDPATQGLLAPQYEARIQKIGRDYLAKKEGYFGVVDASEEVILPFLYQEIMYWNDSSFLIKKDGAFQIVSREGESLSPLFSGYEEVYPSETETIYTYRSDGKMGLMSNQSGTWLPADYSDIQRIGPDDAPLFFAEQHLRLSGFHVVSYVTEKGEIIYTQAYRTEAFDQIICDDW